MGEPKPCASCGGRSALLRFDGVYYFLSCEQCEKSGPRADAPEDAVSLWNSRGATMFHYGEDLRRVRIVRRMECEGGHNGRRDDRCAVNIPMVLAVGGERGRRVTGVLRNVSHFGAFMELTGGDLSAVPVDMQDVRDMETFLFFKFPKNLTELALRGSNGDGAALRRKLDAVQKLRFSPRHVSQKRDVVGMGGCFVKPQGEDLDMLATLVRCAAEQGDAASGTRRP